MPSLPSLTLTAVIDILLVAALVYQAILIVRGRRAAHILTGIGVLVLIYVVAVWTQLELLRTLLATLAPYTAFAIIVMFQSEIRRVLARLGRHGFFGFGSQLQRRESLEELLLAVQQLAQDKTGALVILEREIGLRTFVESGVFLDAQISRDLLLTIFQKGAALHDGAAIVQGDRIAAAACFLPLTMNPVSRKLGTRHRAAVGVTEETDCLAVIVSEETGQVSLAAGGEIDSNVTPEELRDRVAEALGFGVPLRKARRSAEELRRAEES
ncbi:MAG TPA: diadenylate cyclase CdaA [Bryobacteraceae bacterium]|nr:diadenylate cyclase CdaA [Bryobacteraceae bacterium]